MTATAAHQPKRKHWLFLLLAVVALYVLLPQFGVFRHSLRVLAGARPGDMFAAVGLSSLTYLAAAGSYCLLASRKLSYTRTVVIQLALMFVGRLLPAGLGGLSINYVYLRASRHTKTQAVGVVTVNNLIGLAGHVVLIGVALILGGNRLAHVQLPALRFNWLYGFLGLTVIVGVFLVHRWHRRFHIGLRDLLIELQRYRRRPARLGGALLTSMGLTVCNVLSFYYCNLALDIRLPFLIVLLIFTLGITIGTVTPTPGGLGGVEAGLLAGLVAYGVSSADALGVVLAYRLISYWLPLVVGVGAFILARRRGYLLVPARS